MPLQQPQQNHTANHLEKEEAKRLFNNAIPKIISDRQKIGQIRISSLCFKKINEKDILPLHSMVPYELTDTELSQLADTISTETLKESVSQEHAENISDENLQKHFHKIILDNIRDNRRFLRREMNLFQSVSTDKKITLEHLMSSAKKILKMRREEFLDFAEKQSSLDIPEKERLPALNPELTEEIRNGKINTFQEFRSEIHKKNHLPVEYRHIYNKKFNRSSSQWNKDFLNEIKLFPKPIESNEDLNEANAKWDRARDRVIHQLDGIVPFLNTLKEKYHITTGVDGNALEPIDITILNEFRHMHLLELVATLESPFFTTEQKYIAQLIALRTAEMIGIEHHEKMLKLPGIKREMDFEALSQLTDIVKYAICDKKGEWSITSTLPVSMRRKVSKKQQEQLSHKPPDEGSRDSLDELTEDILHPTREPKVLNYRYWTPHGKPVTDVSGNFFKFHFKAIGSKTPESIQAKLVTRKDNIEEIFDLVRAAIVLDYDSKSLTENSELLSQVLSFAEDIGKNCLGLQRLVKGKKYHQLLPGEFVIENKLVQKPTSNPNSSSLWRDIKIYGMGEDGVGREIQLLPEDTYCLDLNPNSPVTHTSYEIDRQLDYILQLCPYLRYKSIHELTKAIKKKRDEEDRLYLQNYLKNDSQIKSIDTISFFQKVKEKGKKVLEKVKNLWKMVK